MEKKTISADQHLALVGLMTLAAKANEQLTEIEAAAREITGEKDEAGHTSDAIYSNSVSDGPIKAVTNLLSRLKLTVAKK